MKMMITETCFNTLRVHISNPTDTVIAIIDCVGIWGGVDKEGANYKSWEILPDLRVVALRCAGKHDICDQEFELIEYER